MSGFVETDALSANPNVFLYPITSQISLTIHGSDVYWAVTAVMAFSTLVFIGLSFRVNRSDRFFHYITAATTLVASIAYFTMASNLGYAAIPVEFMRPNATDDGPFREIFYVRYIDWFVTTPLLLMNLLLTAGLQWHTILYTILINETMVVSGLAGALVASSYKWGYFVFAVVALTIIAYNVTRVGMSHAIKIEKKVGQTYIICSVWTIALWSIYPIAWGLSEGGNVISPDSEAIFYGVLDILAKPVFGTLLIIGHRNIDPRILGLNIRDYNEPIPMKDQENGGAASNGVRGDVHNDAPNNQKMDISHAVGNTNNHATITHHEIAGTQGPKYPV